MSYSQYDEERYILEAVAGIEGGRVLDLGAWHATAFSNSRALIERGWQAVLVEPSFEPFLGLMKEYSGHPRVKVVNAAIGGGSFVEMHATADAVSTSESTVLDRWKEAGGYYGSFWVKTVQLWDIVTYFGQQWDFISIDTEGTSLTLFPLVMDLHPKCICLEHDQPTTENFENGIVARTAREYGYRQLYLNGTNVVYSR